MYVEVYHPSEGHAILMCVSPRARVNLVRKGWQTVGSNIEKQSSRDNINCIRQGILYRYAWVYFNTHNCTAIVAYDIVGKERDWKSYYRWKSLMEFRNSSHLILFPSLLFFYFWDIYPITYIPKSQNEKRLSNNFFESWRETFIADSVSNLCLLICLYFCCLRWVS